MVIKLATGQKSVTVDHKLHWCERSLHVCVGDSKEREKGKGGEEGGWVQRGWLSCLKTLAVAKQQSLAIYTSLALNCQRGRFSVSFVHVCFLKMVFFGAGFGENPTQQYHKWSTYNEVPRVFPVCVQSDKVWLLYLKCAFFFCPHLSHRFI